ncbi:hypothetical protein ACKWTF_015260 [Chironomus riparius]
MAILCEFSNFLLQHNEEIYGCEIKRQVIFEHKELKLRAKVLNGRTNNDVHSVKIESCMITKVPKGLSTYFINLKVLHINASKLKKITKNDLTEYKNLEKFICTDNEVDYLPFDLFEDLKNLEFIDFSGNKLKIIDPNIFDGLDKINHINLRRNPNYTKCFSIYPAYVPNATLDGLKTQLYDKFLFDSQNLKTLLSQFKQKIQEIRAYEENQRSATSAFKTTQELKALASKLNLENQQLKDSNAKLKTDFEYEKLKNAKLLLNFQKGIFFDLSALIQNDATKDFQITIDDHEFSVHKFLLIARSPTLAELLKNNSEVENLNLVDISVDIFKIILKFLYTDELPGDDGTNFLLLFAAAGKLKIEELKDYSAGKIVAQVNADNAFEVFKLGYKYNHGRLRERAFEEIKKKYPKIEFKDEWAIDLDKMAMIIDGFMRREEEIMKLEEEIQRIKDEFSYLTMD